MVEIDSKEVVELFPFAARSAVKCEVSVNRARAVSITVEELLEVVRSNPPIASVHEGYLHATAMWAFYTSINQVISNYTMDTDIKVAEARTLRDQEASAARAAQRDAERGPLSVVWNKIRTKLRRVQ